MSFLSSTFDDRSLVWNSKSVLILSSSKSVLFGCPRNGADVTKKNR